MYVRQARLPEDVFYELEVQMQRLVRVFAAEWEKLLANSSPELAEMIRVQDKMVQSGHARWEKHMREAPCGREDLLFDTGLGQLVFVAAERHVCPSRQERVGTLRCLTSAALCCPRCALVFE